MMVCIPAVNMIGNIVNQSESFGFCFCSDFSVSTLMEKELIVYSAINFL
jgi:hypothetical protein